MNKDKISTIIAIGTVLSGVMTLYFLVLVYDTVFNQPIYGKDSLYTFNCYKRNKMVLSSYGWGYRKRRIFDSREQKIITLPDNCALFKFEE